MNLTPISNVRVGVLTPDGGANQVPITESPFYIAAATASREPYDAYLSVLKQVSGTPDEEMEYTDFVGLGCDIKLFGFKIRHPKIRFDEELTCLDGHHRLALLRHLHGPSIALEITNNEVQSVWVKSSK